VSIYILPLFILIYIGHAFIFLIPFLAPRLNPLCFSKKNEPLWLKPSLKVSEILPICVANRSVKIAYLRIYCLCLTLVVCLFSIFVALNYGHGGFLGDNDFTMFVRQTLMGYLVLSVGVVSPLFYWLQAVLQHQRSGKSIRACCLGLQPIQQLALFSYLLFNIMPLVEVVKSFLGVSSFQPDLMPYFMLWGAVYALVPLVAFTIIDDNRRRFAVLNIRPTGMKSMLSNNFSLKNRIHHQVLNNREFSLDLLEGKPDADIITLIDIAKSSGHFEKAEQMSKYLLERQ
jgi:hypothetical protein